MERQPCVPIYTDTDAVRTYTLTRALPAPTSISGTIHSSDSTATSTASVVETFTTIITRPVVYVTCPISSATSTTSASLPSVNKTASTLSDFIRPTVTQTVIVAVPPSGTTNLTTPTPFMTLSTLYPTTTAILTGALYTTHENTSNIPLTRSLVVSTPDTITAVSANSSRPIVTQTTIVTAVSSDATRSLSVSAIPSPNVTIVTLYGTITSVRILSATHTLFTPSATTLPVTRSLIASSSGNTTSTAFMNSTRSTVTKTIILTIPTTTHVLSSSSTPLPLTRSLVVSPPKTNVSLLTDSSGPTVTQTVIVNASPTSLSTSFIPTQNITVITLYGTFTTTKTGTVTHASPTATTLTPLTLTRSLIVSPPNATGAPSPTSTRPIPTRTVTVVVPLSVTVPSLAAITGPQYTITDTTTTTVLIGSVSLTSTASSTLSSLLPLTRSLVAFPSPATSESTSILTPTHTTITHTIIVRPTPTITSTSTVFVSLSTQYVIITTIKMGTLSPIQSTLATNASPIMYPTKASSTLSISNLSSHITVTRTVIVPPLPTTTIFTAVSLSSSPATTLVLTRSLLAPVPNVPTTTSRAMETVTQTAWYVPVPTTVSYISVTTATVTDVFTLTPTPTTVVVISETTKLRKSTVTEEGETVTQLYTVLNPTTVIVDPTNSQLSLRNQGATLTPNANSIALTTPTPTPVEVESNHVNKGAIAGGVIGGVVGVALLLTALILAIRWRRKKQSSGNMLVGSPVAVESGMTEPRL
ncbi:hypothetical protein RHS04_08890 [Rhizoctonia solani]|uniref:Uncharacterized protein n=1 Tax=Rhizoctonia solani TaxID=456999 RepID=A0A8H7H199_9AGAM|nr:hypothetical protein RHS04_08890 [Rhizoctonia solani]